MNTMLEAQKRVYDVLRSDGSRCFLHVSRREDALWTTDFPSRTSRETAADMRFRLSEWGYMVTEAEIGLWHVTPNRDMLRRLFPEKVLPMPLLPHDEAMWPAYQLCRILLAHPAPFHLQPERDLLAILKLSANPATLGKEAPALIGSAAVALRSHSPVAYHGGLLIAYVLAAGSHNE